MYHILKIENASVELNGIYTVSDLEILIEALKKTENIGKNIVAEEEGGIKFKVEKKSRAVVSAFVEHNLKELDNSDITKVINKLSTDYPNSFVFNLVFKDSLIHYELCKVEKLTLDLIRKIGKEVSVLYGSTIPYELCNKLHKVVPENFVKILANNLKKCNAVLEENEFDTVVSVFNNYIKDSVKELV